MNIKLSGGKYVVAVSGGVDSVVLLDLLAKNPKYQLIVAHFDHGIRKDSAEDALFVSNLAKQYGLPFEQGHGSLGTKASEEKARNARYEFLRLVMKKHRADAVVTAHHQDDVIETVFINLLRGTGARGLFSLSQTEILKRPLLDYSKKQLVAYAKKSNLRWQNDPSNLDQKYLRNYIRAVILPKLTSANKKNLLENLEKTSRTTKEIDKVIDGLSKHLENESKINRQVFSALDSRSGQEFLHARYRKIGDVNRQTIKRLNNAIRTAKPGSRTEIVGGKYLTVDKDWAWLS